MPRRKNGTGTMSHYGYIVVYRNGRYSPIHRLIMEEHLGRLLDKSEIVHHIDGDKLNNNISNLVVVTRPSHCKIHYTQDEKKKLQWKAIQHLGALSNTKIQEPRPEPTEEGLIWRNHKQRRAYIVRRCSSCKVLLWQRKDIKNARFCLPCGARYANSIRNA
jgi:hypothetical protein